MNYLWQLLRPSVTDSRCLLMSLKASMPSLMQLDAISSQILILWSRVYATRFALRLPPTPAADCLETDMCWLVLECRELFEARSSCFCSDGAWSFSYAA